MRNQSGSALLSVILILALVLPLATHVVAEASIDLIIARSRRDQTAALYVAEGGLEYGLASLGETSTWATLLYGPDGIAPTQDDGQLADRAGAAAFGDHESFTLAINRIDATTAAMTSVGSTRHAAAREVVALLRLDATTFTPAALFVAADPSTIMIDGNRFALSGHDDGVISPHDVPLWAVASSAAASAMTLFGHAPAVSGLDLTSVLTAILNAPTAVHVTAGTAPPVLGTANAPQLTIVDGDLTVVANCTGSGVLVVRGALQISAALRFEGLLMAAGRIAVVPTGQMLLSGALWQGPGADGLLLQGQGSIRYSRDALAMADAAAPELLPRALTLLGRKEVL